MISVQARVDTFDLKVLDNYLHDLPAATIRHLHRIMVATAMTVQGDAKESIINGNPSGRITKVRQVRGNKKKGLGARTLIHQASAPGEPPASNTGQLANSILFRDSNNKRKIRMSVGSVVAHGLFTEGGTKKMKKRPWLEPAIDASRPSLEKELFAILREET